MQTESAEEVYDASSPRRAVVRITQIVGLADYSPGDRAMLRRWSPGKPFDLAFFRFAFQHLPQEWERRAEDWQTLTTAIALLSPDPHRPDVSFGKALALAGYAEGRLERLLATEGDIFRTLLLRAARFLRAKNVACNCVDISNLLGLTWDREAARMRIARDYFSELRHA